MLSRRREQPVLSFFFFFNDTATTEIYTLSLTTLFRSLAFDSPHRSCRRASLNHQTRFESRSNRGRCWRGSGSGPERPRFDLDRSEEHTSELQSRSNLVCRLLLYK